MTGTHQNPLNCCAPQQPGVMLYTFFFVRFVHVRVCICRFWLITLLWSWTVSWSLAEALTLNGHAMSCWSFYQLSHLRKWPTTYIEQHVIPSEYVKIMDCTINLWWNIKTKSCTNFTMCVYIHYTHQVGSVMQHTSAPQAGKASSDRNLVMHVKWLMTVTWCPSTLKKHFLQHLGSTYIALFSHLTHDVDFVCIPRTPLDHSLSSWNSVGSLPSRTCGWRQ